MAKRLSNVLLMPAVEGISRKLALRRETCINKVITVGGDEKTAQIIIPGHTYMGVVNRTKNVIGYGSVSTNRLFMRKPIAAQALTQAQSQVRINFTRAKAWVDAAMKDLAVIASNQAKFVAAKNDLTKTIEEVSAAGYQGQRGWMMGVAYALQAADKLPQDHNLPAFDA